MIKHAFRLFSALFLSASFASADSWQPLWQPQADMPGYDAAAPAERKLDAERTTSIHLPAYDLYLPESRPGKPMPAVCIFPGGAYSILALDLEGSEIAGWLNRQGIAAIVVKYRVSSDPKHPERFPHQLMDARRAIRTVRSRAKEWNIDPDKIGVIGFSAGGHLAALATTWTGSLEGETDDEIDKVSPAVNFGMFIYPVISMGKPYTHGSLKGLFPAPYARGEGAARVSPDRQVTANTPPLFVVHSADDPVSPLNSLDIVRAAQEKGVPVEYHLYRAGGHGYGVRQQNKPTDAWPQAAEKWLEQFKPEN